jgi:fucose 4-O-acetylase-like acetyltransferase
MQRDVFIILASTAQRVIRKLLIPYTFFFIIAMIFATMFYAIESGDLFIDCDLNDFAPMYPGYDIDPRTITSGCRWCPVPYAQSNAELVTDKFSKTISQDPDYFQIYQYNGSCKRPHFIPPFFRFFIFSSKTFYFENIFLSYLIIIYYKC